MWRGSADTFAEAVLMPRNETMISFASAGTALMPNFPFASVIVPIVVPLTRTYAPATGCPSPSATTVPVTVSV